MKVKDAICNINSNFLLRVKDYLLRVKYFLCNIFALSKFSLILIDSGRLVVLVVTTGNLNEPDNPNR